MTNKHVVHRKSPVVRPKKAAPEMVAEHHIEPMPVVAKPAEKTFMQRMFS